LKTLIKLSETKVRLYCYFLYDPFNYPKIEREPINKALEGKLTKLHVKFTNTMQLIDHWWSYINTS